MKGVERTNVVMVCPSQRVEFIQCNSYTMKVDRGNRNCYNCRGFEHLARNYRNRGMGNRIGESRRLEYKDNGQSNLNRDEDLIVLN